MLPPPPTPTTPTAPGPVPTATTDGRGALLFMILALVVGGGLSTDRLLGAAEHLPYGTSRSVLVGIGTPVHQVAATVGLDRPGALLDELAGREPRATEPADNPLIGLALGPFDVGAGLVEPAAPPSTLHSEPLPASSLPPAPSSPSTASTVGGPAPPAGPGTGRDEPPVPDHLRQALVVATEQTGAAITMRTVDPANKLRLWAGGDSLGEYVGNQLLFPKADTDLAAVELDYHISTGLARPDYFDWLAQIQTVMEQPQPPEALVFMVGGNDDQNMLADREVLELGTEAWFDEYRQRVEHIMDAAADDASHLYWIGLPPMREPDREAISVEINDIIRRQAEARPWVSFVDIYTLFEGPEGGYQAHLADPDGNQRLARAPDGVHITFAGSEWVADRIWAEIENRWNLGTADTGDPAPGGTVGASGEPEPGPQPEGLTRPERSGSAPPRGGPAGPS